MHTNITPKHQFSTVQLVASIVLLLLFALAIFAGMGFQMLHP